MDYETYLEKTNYLLAMSTKGRLISLVDKFGCATRTISRMLAHLRRQGHPIHYDRTLRRFVLKEERLL